MLVYERILLLFSCLSVAQVCAQYSYDGLIGDRPIYMSMLFEEHSTNSIIDGKTTRYMDINGIYEYNKYHKPILLTGKISNDTLFLGEDTLAVLILCNFSRDSLTLHGIWRSADLKREYPVVLTRNIMLKDSMPMTELIPFTYTPLKKDYYRLVASQEKIQDGEPSGNVFAIRIYDENRGIIKQELVADDYYGNSFDDFNLADINGDGELDISIRRANTDCNIEFTYYFYDKKRQRFFEGFNSTELNFDSDSTAHTEPTDCVVGYRQSIEARYKLKYGKLLTQYEKIRLNNRDTNGLVVPVDIIRKAVADTQILVENTGFPCDDCNDDFAVKTRITGKKYKNTEIIESFEYSPEDDSSKAKEIKHDIYKKIKNTDVYKCYEWNPKEKRFKWVECFELPSSTLDNYEPIYN
jgi:hypothetical protein